MTPAQNEEHVNEGLCLLSDPNHLPAEPQCAGGERDGEELGCPGALALGFAHLGSCRACCVTEQPLLVSPQETWPWGPHHWAQRGAACSAPGRMGAPFPGHSAGEGVTVASARAAALCLCEAEHRAALRLPGLVGELLSFCRGVWVQGGREEGWIAPGPPHGKVGWSWDAAGASPLCRVC